MKKIFALFLGFSLLSTFSLLGQYQAGWLSDNFAGINSVTINPAAPSSTPYRWDVNLIGFEQFFGNNYGFLRNGSLFNFFNKRNDFTLEFEPELRGEPSTADFVLDFYDGARERYITSQTHLLGPSIYFKLGEKHNIGLFTGAHAVFGTQNIPAVFSYWEYDGHPINQPFEVSPFMGSIMTWSEVGVNYSYKTELTTGTIAIGGSVKVLQGYEAGFFELEEAFEFTKLPSDSIAGNQTNIAFGYTNSFTNSFPDASATRNGSGFGLDIGAVYIADSQDADRKYSYKISAAITNIGAINFNRNATAHQLNSDEFIEIADSDYTQYTELSDLDAAVQQFRTTVLKDQNVSPPETEFTVMLPTTFNLSADVNVAQNLYVNASYVQPINFGRIQPGIGSHLSVTPRFEHRAFGGYLPIVYNNLNDFNVGLAGRAGPLVIGTENIGSVFASSDFRSTEFFIALKLNPFWSSESAKKTRKGGGKGPKCYKF